MQGETIYRKFNGRAPKRITRRNMSQPKSLVFIGRAHSIVYESDKRNGGGTGRPELFEHKFSPTTKIFTDEKGKRLYVFGPEMRVNSRGIVG